MEDARLSENKNIARQFFLAFEKGDVAAAIDLFSPDAFTGFPPSERNSGWWNLRKRCIGFNPD